MPQTYDLGALELESDERRKMVTEKVIAGVENETKEAKPSRNDQRKKMFKKTHSGQPVMKYRIEKILESVRK